MKDTVIGKAKTDQTWLHSSGKWTNNLFLAEKYEPNKAALLVTAMKKEGIECHTELVIMAAKRKRDSYIKEG